MKISNYILQEAKVPAIAFDAHGDYLDRPKNSHRNGMTGKGKARRVVGKSRCPKCGRNSLVREKDGWEGAKPRIVCAYVGCREVVSK